MAMTREDKRFLGGLLMVISVPAMIVIGLIIVAGIEIWRAPYEAEVKAKQTEICEQQGLTFLKSDKYHGPACGFYIDDEGNRK